MFVNQLFKIFLLAMTPVGELRLALPVALINYKLSVFWAYPVAVLGNLLPVFFILIFLRYFVGWLMSNFKIFDDFFNWLFERTRKKFAYKYERWGKIALVLFVAIPLPITGAWTGSIAAWLFGFKYWESLGYILLGVCLSGIIVSILTLSGLQLI